MEGAHRGSMILMLPDSELFFKISQGEESVNRIKAFLVFPVTALHLSIVPWSIRTDQLMPDSKLSQSFSKRGSSFVAGELPLLVQSEQLCVWTHSARMPLRAYRFTSRFRTSAEEQVACSR